ncbi:MAG: MMPL family transporter [Alphaproteobacteria bacterium]|nr:MMPL family transporter [Alphaproteobacteria bacterium]MDD9920323.1 MMPL family transporter [Alphaproteobacteria bacterium]
MYLLKPIAAAYKYYLAKPVLVLLAFLGIFALSIHHAQNFYYDASADTLVAENDPDLKYYREVIEHFGEGAFLFLTYTPKEEELLSTPVLERLNKLVAELKEIEGVSAVSSLLDAPLLKSPPIPLAELANNYRTLKSPDVDFGAALKELTTSPLFKNLLISEDGRTTALRIDLKPDHELNELLKKRNALKMLENPTSEERSKLEAAKTEYRKAYAENVQEVERVLTDIRKVQKSIQSEATVYLGGVPMIASDMMHYVQSDIITFGSGSLILMMLMLFQFFRKLRWVVLPVLTTASILLVTTGLLGALHKPVTVVSSNFISLLAILSISIAVHLITRYRLCVEENPDMPQSDIVYRTMSAKIAPCLYTTLTTMAGFASLYASSIIPVMDFGWLMCVGIAISLVIFYFFFPVLLVFLPKEELATPARDNNTPLIRFSYHLAAGHTYKVLVFSAILLVLTFVGVSRLSLDNRFIDYFKKDTEIHQGLAFIDKNLGGTVPMDIIVEFPPFVEEPAFEEEDFFDDFGSAEEDTFPERYWFTPDKIEVLRKLEAYLESRPEIGKIISLATLELIAQEFNNGKPLSAVEIVAILSALPEGVRKEFLMPYASPRAGFMRISTRIHETGPLFSRDQLIKDIEDFAKTLPNLNGVNVKVTGMNVLFNGMLRELLASQTSTLFFVILATFTMFLILLRCPLLALIGVLPNVFSAFLILAFMGFVGMPLDMMTITIAAIVIGIGVDDAIHYLHFFRARYDVNQDADLAVRESHREIGRALYITSLTVMIGFSILCASNFVPTVYFGLLSAMAMLLALLANLILLPALLLKLYGSKKEIC